MATPPPSGTSVASRPSASHAYVANRHEPSARRSMKRVSTGVPSTANSFQNFAPRGNSQASAFDASTAVPSGNDSQRRLVAPSDHSGYCGTNVVGGSRHPVSLSSGGRGGGAADPA